MQSSSEHPELRGAAKHETVDANVRSLVRWGIGVFALLASGLVISVVVFRYFVTHQGLGPPASPFSESRTLPPAPVLQVTPAADLRGYLSQENQTLDTYGWVDEKAGIVRIPIDRAMELLLKEGFPVEAAPNATAPPPGVPGAAPAGTKPSAGARR